MKNEIIALLTLSLVAGCSTAPKNQRTVNVENWPVSQAGHSTSSASSQVIQASTQSNASPEQAKTVCENAEMRRNVVDYDNTNDTVRIMTVQDSSNNSRVLSEVEVDCRDYFLRKSLSPSSSSSSSSNVIKASTTTTHITHDDLETRRITRSSSPRYTYIVQKGDTVWGIAREHCTTAKAITSLNGLGRGDIIDIGQRLRLPDEDCS